MPKLLKAKASPPTALRRDSRRSSSRAESTEPQGRPSRLPLACDSVKHLRKRARKIRPLQEAPEQMAASPLGAECSLPEESSINRSGSLPLIKEETRSPSVSLQTPKPLPAARAHPAHALVQLPRRLLTWQGPHVLVGQLLAWYSPLSSQETFGLAGPEGPPVLNITGSPRAPSWPAFGPVASAGPAGQPLARHGPAKLMAWLGPWLLA